MTSQFGLPMATNATILSCTTLLPGTVGCTRETWLSVICGAARSSAGTQSRPHLVHRPAPYYASTLHQGPGCICRRDGTAIPARDRLLPSAIPGLRLGFVRQNARTFFLRIDDRGSCDLSARSRASPESTIRKSPGHGQLVSLGQDIDCGSVETCLGRTMTPKTDGRSSVLVARLEWSAGTGRTSTLSAGPGS